MKKFCQYVGEHKIKIISFKIKLFTNEQQGLFKKKKNVKMNMWKITNIVKLEIITIIQRNIEVGTQHSVCNLKYCVPKKIFVAFHNGSNYDYHFTMKELVEELNQFTC